MNENKDLLLKYLCMALPYRTAIRDDYGDITFLDYNDVHIQNYFEGIVEGVVRPYLRPMSSMTEEEVNEYNHCWKDDRDDIMIIGKHFEEMYKSKKFTLYMHPVVPMYRHILWLLKNHFDFIGLIPKGLAIEVTKENNPYEN